MTANELQHIIEKGENETTEFKSAFNRQVIEALEAFANTQGGKIVIK